MAQYQAMLPDDVLDDLKRISNDSEKIFGDMVEAGAKVVESNVRANMPAAIRKSPMASKLKRTRSYKTPSDGGINSKVAFYGYFKNKEGRIVPAPLVANIFEYGRSGAPFPKQPFFRKSFRKKDIEAAMLAEQKKVSGGLLE